MRILAFSPFVVALAGLGFSALGPTRDAPDLVVAGSSLQIETMRVHYIDVGQADAALVEFPTGAVLIDAGGASDEDVTALVDYLDEFFLGRTDLNRTLEAIIITHNHVDHTRGLREVVEAFTVERLIENGQRGGFVEGDRDVDFVVNGAAALGVAVTDVDDGDIPGTDGLTNGSIDPIAAAPQGTDPLIRILSADHTGSNTDLGWPLDEFENKNNHSVVVRIDFGEASFLFTGDLEEHAIETLVGFYAGTDTLDVDVYQVGHHGSHNGTTVDLLEAMSPEIAVISMGEWNDGRVFNSAQNRFVPTPFTTFAFGHPRLAIVEWLRLAVSGSRDEPAHVRAFKAVARPTVIDVPDAIYATGWDGTVVLEATADGMIRLAGDHDLGSLLNINTASATELDTLPGIGPVKAQAIVADRQSNGPFATVQALARVPGIGPVTVNAISALVTTGP